MKRIPYILLTAIAALSVSSCVINTGVTVYGSISEKGIDFSEIRDVDTFSEISFSAPCNLYFIQGDVQKVLVEGTEEFVPKVITETEDDELKVYLEDGVYRNLVLKVTIWSPDIKSIKSRGSGNLICEDGLDVSKDLYLGTTGSGNIKCGNIKCKDFESHTTGSGSTDLGDVQCSDFESHTTGSGNIRLGTVSCKKFDISTSGSGSAKVSKVTASRDATLKTSGSGDIKIDDAQVDGDIDAKTSGSGTIRIDGSCNHLSTHSSGSGSVKGNIQSKSVSL